MAVPGPVPAFRNDGVSDPNFDPLLQSFRSVHIAEETRRMRIRIDLFNIRILENLIVFRLLAGGKVCSFRFRLEGHFAVQNPFDAYTWNGGSFQLHGQAPHHFVNVLNRDLKKLFEVFYNHITHVFTNIGWTSCDADCPLVGSRLNVTLTRVYVDQLNTIRTYDYFPALWDWIRSRRLLMFPYIPAGKMPRMTQLVQRILVKDGKWFCDSRGLVANHFATYLTNELHLLNIPCENANFLIDKWVQNDTRLARRVRRLGFWLDVDPEEDYMSKLLDGIVVQNVDLQRRDAFFLDLNLSGKIITFNDIRNGVDIQQNGSGRLATLFVQKFYNENGSVQLRAILNVWHDGPTKPVETARLIQETHETRMLHEREMASNEVESASLTAKAMYGDEEAFRRTSELELRSRFLQHQMQVSRDFLEYCQQHTPQVGQVQQVQNAPNP